MSGAVKVGTETVLFIAALKACASIMTLTFELHGTRPMLSRSFDVSPPNRMVMSSLAACCEATRGHRLAGILGAHRPRNVHRQDDVERLHLARDLGRGADGYGLISEQPHEAEGEWWPWPRP